MANTPSPQNVFREIPPDIAKRLKAWRTLYLIHLYSHYCLGICGVIASALAGFQLPSPFQQIAAGSATVCMAIVGFIRPERKYLKFVRAWRILNTAATRYRYSLAEVSDLVAALDDGEARISEFERIDDTVEPTNRANKQQGSGQKEGGGAREEGGQRDGGGQKEGGGAKGGGGHREGGGTRDGGGQRDRPARDGNSGDKSQKDDTRAAQSAPQPGPQTDSGDPPL